MRYTPSVVQSLAQKSQQAPSLSDPWPFSIIPNICAQPRSHAHAHPEPQSQPTIHDLRPQHPNHRDVPRFLPITDTPASSPPHTSTRGPTHHLSETRLVLGGRLRPCLFPLCMLTELPTCPLTTSALILFPQVPHGSPWPPGLPSPCHPPPHHHSQAAGLAQDVPSPPPLFNPVARHHRADPGHALAAPLPPEQAFGTLGFSERDMRLQAPVPTQPPTQGDSGLLSWIQAGLSCRPQIPHGHLGTRERETIKEP